LQNGGCREKEIQSSGDCGKIMAAVIEIPLQHPARRPNPYHLEIPNAPMFRCPYGCGIGFNERWNLDLHILDKHPNGNRQQAKIEWW